MTITKGAKHRCVIHQFRLNESLVWRSTCGDWVFFIEGSLAAVQGSGGGQAISKASTGYIISRVRGGVIRDRGC